MGDPMDPYREALVVETAFVWPKDLVPASAAERQQIEEALAAAPAAPAAREYVRLASGFCRRITVTPADLQRLKKT